MQKIILDTNFLLYCLRNKIDLFGELSRIINVNYEICILDKTLDELKNKKQGKLAIDFAKKYFEIIKTNPFEKSVNGKKEETVDDLLLKQDAIIATMDKELREKLKKGKKQIIILRQKKYLKFL